MSFDKNPSPTVWFYPNEDMLCGGGLQARLSMQQALIAKGVQLSETLDTADYAILASCGDRGLEQLLQRLMHINLSLGESAIKIVLAGCAANYGPESIDWNDIKDLLDTDILVAAQNEGESRTDALLRTINQDSQESIPDLTIYPNLYSEDLDQQSIYIQHNCHNGCWYCSKAAAFSRAPLSEAPIEKAKSTIDEIKARGIRNLHIGGTNISLYKNLLELMQYIQSLDHFDSVEISGAAPQNITPKIVAAINMPVVSSVEITCDVTDPELIEPMRHMSLNQLESIYSQIDPSKLKVTNLVTNLPDEKTGDAYGEQARAVLSRNNLFTRAVTSFVPPAVQMLQKQADIPESYIIGQLNQAVNAAESVNQEIVNSYKDKFMTVRVNKIFDDSSGVRFAVMNMFGYGFMLYVPMIQKVLDDFELGSELQVGEVVNVMIGDQYEIDKETRGGTLIELTKNPPYGFVKSRPIRFWPKGIERSDRRPSYKRYDSYEEMTDDSQEGFASAV